MSKEIKKLSGLDGLIWTKLSDLLNYMNAHKLNPQEYQFNLDKRTNPPRIVLEKYETGN
jgi:hypothetical protein